jgi:DNA-binding PadR family transcriptional regulator
LVSRITTMVLGLLIEGEKHGYELIREMDARGMLRWTHASKVAVYKALARLEEEDCLTSWTEKAGSTPEKRVYAITKEGEEKLKDQVYSLCASQEPLRFETSVGMAFIGHLSRDEAEDALEKRRRFLEGQAKRLDDEMEIMEDLAGEMYMDMLRHELEGYKKEIRWIKSVGDRIAGDVKGRGKDS